MHPFLKIFLAILSIFFLMQVVQTARLRRNENSSPSNVKQPADVAVKALGEILIKKLEDSLKDCDQTVKNILSCAKNSLQNSQAVPVAG